MIGGMTAQSTIKSILLSDIEEPRARDAREPESPLYNSKRGYLPQIDAYHDWQRRDG